jgi:hypothetical protein
MPEDLYLHQQRCEKLKSHNEALPIFKGQRNGYNRLQ